MTSSDPDEPQRGIVPLDPATLPPRPEPPRPAVPGPEAPVPAQVRTRPGRAPEGPRWPWLGLAGCLVVWLGLAALVAVHGIPGLRERAPALQLLAYGWLPVALFAVGMQGDSPRFRLRRTLAVHRWTIIALSVVASLAGIAWQVKRWLL